jgi:hypothetical protein
LFSLDYFRIKKQIARELEVKGAGKFYTWEDSVYREFMVEILMCLKPRRALKGEIMFRPLESVDEVIFLEKGSIDIGFVLNDIPKNVVRLSQGGVIGVFNVTFNLKTRFLYTCFHTAQTYGIKKADW